MLRLEWCLFLVVVGEVPLKALVERVTIGVGLEGNLLSEMAINEQVPALEAAGCNVYFGEDEPMPYSCAWTWHPELQ